MNESTSDFSTVINGYTFFIQFCNPCRQNSVLNSRTDLDRHSLYVIRHSEWVRTCITFWGYLGWTIMPGIHLLKKGKKSEVSASWNFVFFPTTPTPHICKHIHICVFRHPHIETKLPLAILPLRLLLNTRQIHVPLLMNSVKCGIQYFSS